MKRHQNQPVTTLLLRKASLTEIIISVIVMGFGVSLTVSSMTLFENFKSQFGFYGGLITCIISLLYIILRLIIRKKDKFILNGFFILNEDDNMIIDIDGYRFANELNGYLNTAFTENKAMEHIWNSDPLRLEDELKIPESRSMSIIRESIEYFLLDSLFHHLLSYFNYPTQHNKNISLLERGEIPSILLRNRFLELFSKPMQDREHFIGLEDINKNGEHYILEVDGAIYRKFLLVLPYKSKVQKVGDNEIIINTKRLSMSLKVDFDGTNTNLPDGFKEHYLGIRKSNDYWANVEYDVKVEITINFKLRSLLSPAGWKDYEWVDSFLDRLETTFSKDRYFESIDWNTAYTIIKCLFNKKNEAKMNSNT